MCGIVGYIGKGNTLPSLIGSLQLLSDRGYNAVSISYRNGGPIETCRASGQARELFTVLPSPLPVAGAGLGHARWESLDTPAARHAAHLSGGIAAVHSGIIENHGELKAWLLRQGYSCDEDNGVIPNLIRHFQRQGLPLRGALRKAVGLLKGSFALGLMCDDRPDTLFAAMRGSPLAIARTEEAFCFSSDPSALGGQTQDLMMLKDGQVCALKHGGVEVYTLDAPADPAAHGAVVDAQWGAAPVPRGMHEHCMLQEIHEQPEAIRDTLSEWVEDLDRLIGTVSIAGAMTSLRRIHIVGCGTSYHAALIGRYIIERFVHIPVCVDMSSEFRQMEPILTKGTVLITISQSGETVDTLAAQRAAKARGIPVSTICNTVGSTAAREADAVLYTRAGKEEGVAATKTFTAQVAALCLLGIALGAYRRKLTDVELQTLKSFLAELPSLVRRVLGKDGEIRAMAPALTHARGILYLGEGINYPVALEGALKMKELAYIHAVGCPAGEIKYGPLALVEQGSPVVVLAPMASLGGKILSTVEDVKARGARIIALTDAPAALRDLADVVVALPSTHPAFLPFVSAIPLQLLAYHVAVLKGHNVDRPRNLTKSVTEE